MTPSRALNELTLISLLAGVVFLPVIPAWSLLAWALCAALGGLVLLIALLR